jgi:hypothetical protein
MLDRSVNCTLFATSRTTLAIGSENVGVAGDVPDEYVSLVPSQS